MSSESHGLAVFIEDNLRTIFIDLLIQLTQVVDNNEVEDVLVINKQIKDKNIMQYLVNKYGEQYNIVYIYFRMDQLNKIIDNSLSEYGYSNKLPTYNNGLSLLIGIILKTLE